MKKLLPLLISLAIILSITLFLTLGPYNLYHHFNAENIVKESGILKDDWAGQFFSEEIQLNTEDIVDVEYLGRNSYLVIFENEEEELKRSIIIRLDKSKTSIMIDIFTDQVGTGRMGY